MVVLASRVSVLPCAGKRNRLNISGNSLLSLAGILEAVSVTSQQRVTELVLKLKPSLVSVILFIAMTGIPGSKTRLDLRHI